MALRVSLQIDGDAKGAEEAAAAASQAIGDIGKSAEQANNVIEGAFNKAAGAADKTAESTKAAGAANDNLKGAAFGLAAQLDQVAQKALGSDTALAKLSGGAVNLAKGVAGLSASAGVVGFLSGAIGIAITAASVFYGIVNDGGAKASKQLDDNAKQVGIVRDAFKDAANKAGDFYTQTANVSRLLLTLSADKLKSTLQSQVGSVISGATTYNDVGGFFNKTKQVKAEFQPFEDAIFKLQDGFKAGTPDVRAFMDEVSRIGNADPAVRKAAGALVEMADGAGKTAQGIAQDNASMAVLNGTATEAQKKIIGLGGATRDMSSESDRLFKAMGRQAAAQEAEAASVGKSVGEVARLRAEFILTENAQQRGIKVSGEYAAQIDAMANRFGTAAQKAAEARLQSDLVFERSQIGRSTSDGAVADRLRGIAGDDVTAALNGSAAAAIRFNDDMKELKGTTLEVSQGIFRDFRTELMNGTSAWQAFGKAGVNALGRIADKLADKAFDGIVSKIFGTALGGGSGSGGIFSGIFGGGSPSGYADGGFTGFGGKYEPAGIVHRGEYVIDAVNTARIGVGNLDRLRGYAEGGFVTPAWGAGLIGRDKFKAASFAAAPIQIAGGDTHVTITGNADEKAIAKMRRMFAERDARFHGDVVQSVKDAQTWRQL